MNNEQFIATKIMDPTPTDVKGAIALLSELIKQRKDSDLLIKIGAIQGAYAVYERTGDVSILEHLIIDIIMLFKNVTSQSCIPNDAVISIDDLVEDFLNKLEIERDGISSNTRKNYLASLRKIFKDMSLQVVSQNRLRELATEIDNFVKTHPEYNHNVKSAANGIVRYLREI